MLKRYLTPQGREIIQLLRLPIDHAIIATFTLILRRAQFGISSDNKVRETESKNTIKIVKIYEGSGCESVAHD